MADEHSHFTQSDRNAIVELKTMMSRAVSDIAKLSDKVDGQGVNHASKHELDAHVTAIDARIDELDKRTADVPTMRLIVYGLVALILTSVVGVALTLLLVR